MTAPRELPTIRRDHGHASDGVEILFPTGSGTCLEWGPRNAAPRFSLDSGRLLLDVDGCVALYEALHRFLARGGASS